MSRKTDDGPREEIAANVRAALNVAEEEQHQLVAYLCRMILEEIANLDYQEYRAEALRQKN